MVLFSDRSARRGGSTIFALILVWFGLRYLPGMSLAQPTRTEVVLWGLAEGAAVLLLFVGACFQRLSARKIFGLRTKSDRLPFYLLGFWLAACLASGFLGVVRGNDWGYLLGDVYRFGSLPVMFGVLYFFAKDPADVERLLRWMVGVYGVIVLFDLVRFNTFLMEEQERLTTETAHQAGMVAAAVIYLMLFDPKRWVRRGCIALLLSMMLLLLRAQMLTPLITSLVAMALFFAFSRRFAAFLGCAMAAAIFIIASFYSLSVAPTVPSYIADKLAMAQELQGPAESLEALSGVRLGEIISIGEEFTAHPASLLLGTGQGSFLSPDPIPDPLLPVIRYSVDKHYVHSGLFDALYHNGLLALGAFLVLVAHLFLRGVRLRAQGNPFGLFVMVTLMVTILLLGYDLPFESAYPLVGICFSGVSVIENSVRMPADSASVRRIRLAGAPVTRKIRSRPASGPSGAGIPIP